MDPATETSGRLPAHPGPAIWILSTGTEILQGLYPDTNAAWLSRELFGLGLPVARHMAVADEHGALREALELVCRSADLTIMTGGLGPTADDLNRATVAEAYGVRLREDTRALEQIRRAFSSRGRQMAASNAVQALIPEGAEILYNAWGTAPGFLLRPPPRGGLRATLLALPGPPREMQPMFQQLVRPRLLELFAADRRAVGTLTLHTVGLAESDINDRIRDLFGQDSKVNVALLAGRWRVDVRLTFQGDSPEDNAALETRWREMIHDRLGGINIWGEGDVTFPEAIGRLLSERRETLALAESCTGGLIAKQITDVPGSSDYFLEGFVVYSNEAKIRRLAVPEALLATHGAVSPEVAEAMARGARQATGADWALSVTGIAGPGGGTPEKPVGLMYFGLAAPDGRLKHRRVMGFRDREAIRELAAVTGLDILRRALVRYHGLDEPPEAA